MQYFRQKKIVTISFSLLVVLVISGVICFFQFNKQSEASYLYYVPEQVIDHYEFMGDKGAVAIQWKDKNPKEAKELREQIQEEIDSGELNVPYDAIIGGDFKASTSDYIIKEAYKLETSPDLLVQEKGRESVANKGEYWYLDFYQVIGQTIDPNPRRIDLFKAVYEYNKDYFPYRITRLLNRKYLFLLVAKRTEKMFPETIGFYLNIETGKIVDWNEVKKDTPENRYGEIDYPLSITIEHKDRGFTYTTHRLTYTDNEKAKEWKITQDYPNIHQMLIKGNDLYVLSDRSLDRQIASILQEFEKPGVDVFQDSKIYKDESKDGQEHVVNSYQEFMDLYNGKYDWIKDE